MKTPVLLLAQHAKSLVSGKKQKTKHKDTRNGVICRVITSYLYLGTIWKNELCSQPFARETYNMFFQHWACGMRHLLPKKGGKSLFWFVDSTYKYTQEARQGPSKSTDDWCVWCHVRGNELCGVNTNKRQKIEGIVWMMQQ